MKVRFIFFISRSSFSRSVLAASGSIGVFSSLVRSFLCMSKVAEECEKLNFGSIVEVAG